MRINTNVAALNSYNKLSNTQNNLSKSLSRLSSGKRINGAADDAAGLAISEKMNSQTRGLAQAQRNAQDGISMIQTAEGALKETHSILQRMRELSVQSANDTNTEADRAEIQEEVNQLNSELDRISSTTEFNTKKLLNGEAGISVGDGSIVGNASATADTAPGTFDVEVNALATTAQDVTVTDTDDGAVEASDTVAQAGTLTINGTDVEVTATDTVQDVMDSINSISGVKASINDSDQLQIESTDVGADASLTISASADAIIGDDAWNTTAADESGTNASLTTLDDPDGTDISGDVTVDGNDINVTKGSGKGLSFKAKEAGEATTIDVGGTLAFQIGSNSGQTMNVSINDVSTSSLGVSNLDVTTTEGADDAITSLDEAIATVSSERSRLGAYQNRLDHTINNLNTAEENLTAAESRISDVDMAKEMMNMSKQQILSQAGTAMMAQANQLPQGVLQLLG